MVLWFYGFIIFKGSRYRCKKAISEFLVPLFQSRSQCKTILMKMTELHDNETACRTHLHMKGFSLTLVLKKREKGTRKWPIVGQGQGHDEVLSHLLPVNCNKLVGELHQQQAS